MSIDSDKLRTTLAEQLSSFDDQLAGKVDELQMLTEIRQGIGRLLEASGGKEADIRRVLQERYDAGELRRETFQLVKSMLDRYGSKDEEAGPSEHTSPLTAADPDDESDALASSGAHVQPAQQKEIASSANDDPFSSTDVIAPDILKSDSADGRVQVGSVLRDRFMLQQRVSGGSMGVVYKALDRRLAEAGSKEPWVAIKVLSPKLSRHGSALRALQQEAAKGRCLSHPNIVRFVDFDRDDDLYFIVMEWLEGRTLADILDSPDNKTIDRDRAFEIVRSIGKALDYAHRCGIVHADVKPGNIMVLPSGEVKLFDFGVARVRQKQDDGTGQFDPGVLGALTPAYSSMQVLTGEDPVPSDDVFSLACLLYRLVAGYRVFGPRNAAEAAEEGMKPQPLKSLTDSEWKAVKRALSYARVTRFDSISEFLQALYDRSADTGTIAIGKHVEFEDSGGSFKYVMALVVLLAILGVAAYQFGVVDEVLRYVRTEPVVEFPPPKRDADRAAESSANPGSGQGDAATIDAAAADDGLVQAGSSDSEAGDAAPGEIDTAAGAEDASPDAASEAKPQPVDFATLPPADVEVPIAPGTFEIANVAVTLREDSPPVIMDLVRSGPIDLPLTLRLEEIGFSGNRSPWVSGQLEISGGGFVDFPAGQERARVILGMASDPLREADQQSTLRVREADAAAIELATIEISLEDDDQRQFESGLPSNTVAFAASQVSVQERDPAVQIDLVRFNPDDTALVVGYVVRDVTATAGEDYFPPGGYSITFGPGQRSARLLIPLVQDSDYEGDEAFVVELSSGDSLADMDVYYRVAVMIRDDDRG